MSARSKNICLVVASEMTVLAFLKEHILALSQSHNVTLVVNSRDPDFATRNGLSVKLVPVTIERAINPFADLRALYHLYRLFRRERFDLVHSVTPKAGLLAMLAGKLAGIGYRIHTFTGQVWATKRGFSRWLLKLMDRILAASASHLLADSASQRQFLIDQRISSAEKLGVLADGSISGVDVDRFKPDIAQRSQRRSELGIADDDSLLLFLGRLNIDKGVLDLAEAFAKAAGDAENLHLLFVGPDEGGMKQLIQQRAGAYASRLHFIDYTSEPESWFAAADIFCLPSYREGFGSVVIEAAACGVPAIGSRIYGVSDAIADGESGLLVPAADPEALAEAISTLCCDEAYRLKLADAALQRARSHFASQRLVDAWVSYYEQLQPEQR